jgi:hypothetical protein
MPEPIEITAKDIIRRPADLITGAAAPKKGNIISQFKNGLEQVKEIKKLLDDLGINMGDLLGGGTQPGTGMNIPPRISNGQAPPADARAPAPAPPPPAMSGLQQAKNFCRLLQLKYGDIPINEMLEKMKVEFGDRKISDFLK